MSEKNLPGESENSFATEQTKTLEVLNNSGLGEYVEDIGSKYNLSTFEQLSGLPIPLTLISTIKTTMETSEGVKKHFYTLTEAIKDESTALEIPFCIVGRTALNENNTGLLQFDRLTFLFTDFDELKQTSVSYNPEKLGMVVANIRKGSSENTLILGHTHPITTPEVQENLLTTKIDAELKSTYGIKEPGLNLSLQDIYQLVYLREHLEEDIRLILAVIMYNGDKALVEIKDNKLARLVE